MTWMLRLDGLGEDVSIRESRMNKGVEVQGILNP